MALAIGVDFILEEDVFAPAIVDHPHGIKDTCLGDTGSLVGISSLFHLELLNHQSDSGFGSILERLEFFCTMRLAAFMLFYVRTRLIGRSKPIIKGSPHLSDITRADNDVFKIDFGESQVDLLPGFIIPQPADGFLIRLLGLSWSRSLIRIVVIGKFVITRLTLITLAGISGFAIISVISH